MTDSVSVIVPLFDGVRFVAETLESILSQDPPPAEVIVVDDGSTDGGREVAASYAPAVTVLRQAHAGVAAARNRGVAVAGGDLLAFCDDDDLYTEDGLGIRVRALAADPSLEAVFGALAEFSEPGAKAAGARAPRSPGPARHVGTLLIRREAFARCGPFHQSAGRAEFVDWVARAVEAGLRYAELDEVVMRRRLHSANTGLRQRGREGEYAYALKAALDRRRGATSQAYRGDLLDAGENDQRSE